jgi:hypothetical protein
MTLATLDEVKAYLDIPEDDTTRDDVLQGLVDSVSREIVRFTGREIAPMVPASDDDDDVTRIVSYRAGDSFIDLYPYEARSVSAVTVDFGGSYPWELVTVDYMLEPITSPNGVYDRIMLRNATRRRVDNGFDRMPVAVTGRWGWPEVPAEVKGWVYELVEDRFREDVAAYADIDGNVSAGPGGPKTIPFRIRDAMAAIKRPYIGAV